ncbi:MAG: formylglycine-generating enzyme family protein [Nostoc sp.]|uniref:formylglycine-generating enzyme family protein n=1 Tax=Nostoc sp. TaxID=1180 RepID=UPI002FF78CB8
MINSTAFAATIDTTQSNCPQEMALIPEGSFKIGSDNSSFVEERSAENVTVTSFCIDKYEVTNAQFTQFVQATGYVTVAERPLSKEEFPDLPDEQRSPGSLVFQIAKPGESFLSWWHWTTGANWQHPFGPDSVIAAKENHPVVHIAYEDAAAYAKWAGKSLPTEAQWEYAARGGLDNTTYIWGNQYSEKKANTWQGIFPFFNTRSDGYLGTAPVGSFAPNGYGLYDMAGNVWELTLDWFALGHDSKTHSKS